MANPIGLLITMSRNNAGKLQHLENEIESIKEAMGLFRAFDARDYITYPLSNYSKIWRYRGNYYHIKKDLYNAIKANNDIDKTYQTFTSYDDEDLWKYKVNTVYLAKLSIPYYISTDGIFFTEKFSPLSTIGSGGQVRIRMDGQDYYLYCGYYTYKYFVDKEYSHPQNKIFYLVSGYSNSRIDVLTPHQDSIEKEEAESSMNSE